MNNEARHIIRITLLTVLAAVLMNSCSTTSNLPDDEVLYTGMKKTTIHDKKNTYEESVALTEVEAALAYAPNNSFMGSTSIRTPLPIGLWVYNSMVNKEHSGFGRWVMNTFGSTPITISSVNPATRTKVATNTLQNYGYFNGYVDYELIKQRNPRKQKVHYDIHLGEPYLYDTIQYLFRSTQDSIVKADLHKSYLKKGGQFSVPDLQLEQERITSDFRNNGYYFFRTDYIKYFADSIQVKNRLKMRVSPNMDMPDRARRQFYIGNIHTYIRRSSSLGTAQSLNRRRTNTSSDSLTTSRLRTERQRTIAYDDSITRPGLRYVYQGSKPPIKPQVLFKNYRFKRKDIYRQRDIENTITSLSNMKVFQQVQFQFIPRDSTIYCDTLDVRVNAMMDKLVDAELDFAFTQKSNAQVGPNASLRLSKRNAFGHGETFSVGMKGSYEWQTGKTTKVDGERLDSWEAGLDASLSYPWLAFPKLSNKFFLYPSSTLFKISVDNLKRAGYYRLVSFGAEATYTIQDAHYATHQITPISITYNNLINTSERFDSITSLNTALYASMRDQFIPAMQYIYTYDNAQKPGTRFTTRFVFLVKESANIINSINALCGEQWNQRDKKLLNTPYSQFLKLQLELANKFKLTDKTQLATRVQLGTIFTYGNSRYAPYSELFYAGGANSIRAFGTHTIGPGRYYDTTGRNTYLDQAGDFKAEANVEYRFNIVSNLNGALFLDAGNVWNLRSDDSHPQGKLGDGGFFKSLAVGTGFGLRYDLEFLVLRLDLGIGIHAPYDTGKNGYYNIPKFKDGLGLHFAVGYPF